MQALLLMLALLSTALSARADRGAEEVAEFFALSERATPKRPKIWLATMAPGQQFFEVFGHNALIVDDGTRRRSFNFGYFDFAEAGFLKNFIDGVMQYQLVVLDADRDLANYRSDGRAVRLQWLDLDDEQSSRLIAHLEQHASPERRRYRYDYFLSNCSTKVRDAIDHALEGQLEQQTKQRSHGYSFRSLALAHSTSVAWMYLGMHAGLGKVADKPLAFWQEFYIPSLLMRALEDIQVSAADGRKRALVKETITLGAFPALPSKPFWLPLLIATIVGTALAFLLKRASAKISRVSACLALGIGGLMLCFFWLASQHWAAALNQNLAHFNPLYIALPLIARRIQSSLALALFAIAVLVAFAKVLPFFGQTNLDWVLLLLPVQWAIWRGLVASDAARSLAAAAPTSPPTP